MDKGWGLKTFVECAQERIACLEAVADAARVLVPDLQHMRSTNAALRLLILRLGELDALGKSKGKEQR